MQQLGSPAADPLFSPSATATDPSMAAKMPANPKPQPTLASFFSAKPRPGGKKLQPQVAGDQGAPMAGPGEELVGRSVEVFWEEEEDWYSGTVLSFTPQGGHVISYEDDSVVTHDLSQMRYRACPQTEPQVAGVGEPAQSEAVAAAPKPASHSQSMPAQAPTKAIACSPCRKLRVLLSHQPSA